MHGATGSSSMSRDITSALRSATEQFQVSGGCCESHLHLLASALGGDIDWDPGAGEEWARVLVQGEVVLAVHLRSGLVLVREAHRAVVGTLLDGHVAVVEVPDFDATCLAAEPPALLSFAGRTVEPALDPRGFSALDLWYVSS